jgi:hypothetical protein
MAFVTIDVQPGEGCEDGILLRFRTAGDPGEIASVPHESEAGLAGEWRAYAIDDADASVRRPAQAVLVEDSSDGIAWLVAGGSHGLLLVHQETAHELREPYLLLARTTPLQVRARARALIGGRNLLLTVSP